MDFAKFMFKMSVLSKDISIEEKKRNISWET